MQKITISLLSLILCGQMFGGMAPGFAQRVCPVERDRVTEASLAYERAEAEAEIFRITTSRPRLDDLVALEKYNQQLKKLLQDMKQSLKDLRRANDLLERCLDNTQ